jgi:hypothetical protein
MMPLKEKKHQRKCLLMPVYDTEKVSRIMLSEILKIASATAPIVRSAQTHSQDIAEHRVKNTPQLLLGDDFDQVRAEVGVAWPRLWE